MKNFLDFRENCVREGAQSVTEAGLRTMQKVRNLPVRPLTAGCRITFTNSEVLSGPLRPMGPSAPFLIASCVWPDGYEDHIKVYLSALDRSVQGVDGNGNPVWDVAFGTCNQAIRNCETWLDAVSLLRERTVLVDAIRRHEVQNPRTGDLRKVVIMDLDFV